MKYQNIREEELKNKVSKDFFWLFDTTKIIGNIDYCVCLHKTQDALFEQEYLLWAEAKKGTPNTNNSFVQLILTIGKARTFDKHLPPAMLGIFDYEKIAFLPYSKISDVFYINDFNWNVTPSNHDTKEFKLIYEKVISILNSDTLQFDFIADEKELKKFIKNNFIDGKFGITKTKIDKNNFMVIYNKWLKTVKPTIAVNWDIAKKTGIIDGDFYLADLLSEENVTLKEKLFVLLKNDHYELDRSMDDAGMFSSKRSDFMDKQVAHTQFWNRYDRPPNEEYWEYIVARRDLLVPQDVRERKGSFYTPQIWVELSQKYLTDVLGEDWQDEYYIWDCAAGTGNLLNGLTNKYNIWASTLDKQDVEVMRDRIKNGANLLEEHVFQFDFLNDEFTKLPQPLQDIINNPKKRKKLVVYINPPYAETATNDTKDKDRINKRGVSFTKIQKLYHEEIGIATKELFVQFLIRIVKELKGSIIAEFSKMKIIQGPNFSKFRNHFKPKFKKGFVCQANTFDNVKGIFPIGFMIWDSKEEIEIEKIGCDVIEIDNQELRNLGTKTFYAYEDSIFITDWFRKYHNRIVNDECIGSIGLYGSDFQHSNFIAIYNVENHPNRYSLITFKNLIQTSIYFAVRHCIQATWLNDRDQFLFPSENWEKDRDFQNNCLSYAFFSNTIQSKYGTNHWIPFTEQEVNAREKFESNFMSQFIKGKLKVEDGDDLFETNLYTNEPLVFSAEAQATFDAGLELWKYYHQQHHLNVNASLYDIREFFQGRNEKGKMNNKSKDETYNALIGNLRESLKVLAA